MVCGHSFGRLSSGNESLSPHIPRCTTRSPSTRTISSTDFLERSTCRENKLTHSSPAESFSTCKNPHRFFPCGPFFQPLNSSLDVPISGLYQIIERRESSKVYVLIILRVHNTSPDNLPLDRVVPVPLVFPTFRGTYRPARLSYRIEGVEALTRASSLDRYPTASSSGSFLRPVPA